MSTPAATPAEEPKRESVIHRVSRAVATEARTFKNGLTMTGGDWGSLTQLFFDNLSTLLGALLSIQALSNADNFGGIAVSEDVSNGIVWGKIAPGVGLTMVIGNIFYTWQGCRATAQYNRQYTANPYGINTPAAFTVIFGVLYPTFFAEGGGDAGISKAYQVALAANFVVGLITIVLGIVGPFILKVVPPAGLLVPIAGIGAAFLGLDNVAKAVAQPLIGFNTIMWVYLGWYANVRLGYGKVRLPEALQVILIGVIMGWATGVNTPEQTAAASQWVKWYGPTWTGNDVFDNFADIPKYLGTIIPLGISAAATSLMCLVSAKEAGDPYPVRTSMIFDGIGTCLAACLGSPFGLCLYIGHPAHKRNGAKIGYSLLNGFVYLILSWFGVLALIQSVVNPATIGPIVFFVGLQVNEEALNFMPSRQYAAYIIGIFPAIFDWVVTIADRSAMASDDGTYNTNSPSTQGWFGLLAWKNGSLLVSLLWTSMLVMVLDRKWFRAGLWALVASIFAVFGIIHSFEAGFKSFTSPAWQDCPSEDLDLCWQYSTQWMYFTAYLMLTATFFLIHFVAKYDDTIEGAIEDETSHAFDDWFADAYKYVDDDGVVRDSRHPEDGDLEYDAEMNKMESKRDHSSKRIGDEMAGTLAAVYGNQENEDADDHYGNEDHIGDEVTKTMDKVFNNRVYPIDSDVSRETSSTSSTH